MLSAFIRKFLLITTTLLTALDLALLAQQVNIRRYSIEDGLVNNDVLNIYQDQQGFIWLCTRGGLSRYDGSRFTNYTTASGLDQDMINDIIEVAPQEFIIAQNSDGPCLLKNGRITPILPKTKITLNGFYLAANSRLVATTDLNGMAEWDKRNIRRLDSSTRSIAIMTVINDSVWLLYDPAAGIQLTNSSFKSLSPITPVFATTLFTDSQNQTWIGTTTGLRLLNPTIQQGQPPALLPLPASFDLPVLRQGYIYDFMEDSRGNYWIATGAGLLKIDTGGNSQLYTEKDGWSQEHINCMKEDDQHNIWIGSTTGLLRFSTNPEIKKIVTGFGKLYDGIAGISPVGTNKVRLFGIKHTGELDLQTGELDNLQNHSSASVLYKLNSRETLLVNGEKGTIYQVGKKEVETIRWPLKYFSDVVKIDPGLFLCALDKDLFLVSNGHYTKILTIATGSQVNKMAIDKRNFLWVGTWSNGLFKMKISNGPGSLQLKIIDTIASRLPDRYIRAIYTDKENELWIGTRNKGVIRLLEHTNGDCEVQHYGTGEGLSSNFVIVINRDSSGNIWAGSKQGLDKLIPAGNRYRVFNFGWLKKFHADVSDIHFLSDNSLVAAGASLILHVRDAHEDSLPPPSVYITRIASGPAEASFLLDTGFIRLPTRKAQIYFEFSAPQFINENFTKYSYRLLGGHDTGWTIAGQSRSVYFANLRPGAYTFEVRALGFNGNWGEKAIYSFIVNTPFWQKLWFILLMIMAAAAFAYALYRYRVQQLIRLHKVRNRIATDLHDEIGSNLTNISILTNLSKKNLSQPGKASDFLQRISEEVASSSQALDDIIWSVNTNHDTLEETVARMRRYAAELFDAANISYELYLDPAFEEKKLSMEQRRDIYLLYKEVVNNIAKHAAASEVNIRIAIEHSQLLLHIKDNGKGFDTTKETDRHGLKGMKERVQKWKGKMIIETAPLKGTSIQIWMPVVA